MLQAILPTSRGMKSVPVSARNNKNSVDSVCIQLVCVFSRAYSFVERISSLPLYMDMKDPISKANPAVSALKVQLIPAKFVIDGNGVIRFHLIGFGSGKDEAHVNELSAMIELAKKSF